MSNVDGGLHKTNSSGGNKKCSDLGVNPHFEGRFYKTS